MSVETSDELWLAPDAFNFWCFDIVVTSKFCWNIENKNKATELQKNFQI